MRCGKVGHWQRDAKRLCLKEHPHQGSSSQPTGAGYVQHEGDLPEPTFVGAAEVLSTEVDDEHAILNLWVGVVPRLWRGRQWTWQDLDRS